jgi:hypothetical protein
MKAFLIGTIFGIIVATVGVNGIIRIADNVFDLVKTNSQQLAQPK